MSAHLSYVEAVVVGAFQGVTELFPVSSLGHSVLVPALVGGDVPDARAHGARVAEHEVGIEVLRERLSTPQFAIFFAPSSRGGSGSDGSRPPANPLPSQPGSLEAIVSDWRNRQTQYQAFGLRPKN